MRIPKPENSRKAQTLESPIMSTAPGLPLFSILGYVLQSLCRELTRDLMPPGMEKNDKARGVIREGEPD